MKFGAPESGAGRLLGHLLGTGNAERPPGPEFAWLLASAGASNLGLAFLWPLTALYVHHVLHQSMTVVGFVMMAQAGASVLGSLVGGVLYDARGARLPLIWAVGSSAVMLAVVGWDRNFWVFSVGVFLISFAISTTMPIFNALAATTWPEGGRSSFNAVYVAINAGVAIGSSLGGLFASISFRLAFLFAALVTAALWAIMVPTYRGGAWTAVPPRRIAPHGAFVKRHMAGWQAVGGSTMILALALGLQWMAYDQWEVTVPNFMQFEGFALPLYSLLWTLNTLLILVAQPVLSRVVTRIPRVTTQLLMGSGLFLLGFGTLAISHTYPAYIIAMVISTLGEMLVLPGVPAAAETRTPPDRRGLVQGVVGTGGSLGRMAGPLVGGLVYSARNPGHLFTIMLGVIVLGGVFYVVSDRVWKTHGLGQAPSQDSTLF